MNAEKAPRIYATMFELGVKLTFKHWIDYIMGVSVLEARKEGRERGWEGGKEEIRILDYSPARPSGDFPRGRKGKVWKPGAH